MSLSGPESFTGLPGMILKLALPRQNIIWTATKVTPATAPLSSITPPSRGKAADNKALKTILDQALKDKGVYAKIYLTGMML